MSLQLWYEDSTGTMVQAPGRLRKDTLEVTFQAEEGATGESTLILDDPDGDFYIRGHKALYLVETEAAADDFFGIIGPVFAWNRVFRRGPYRTDAGREVVISVKDINTLLTRRVQKGNDAERPQETDVARMTWLINTPEVIGGSGNTPEGIGDTTHFYTDSPVTMSETNYGGQDSNGVINDALQDSGKNAYLYNSPTSTEPIRAGIWYGRTERAEFVSAHSISNDLADIDPDTLTYFTENPVDLEAGAYTFAPSIDAELDRDPSRVVSGAYVNFDGGYRYTRRPATAEYYEFRDGVFQAELVKSGDVALARGNRYLRDLRFEDDAITCAVLVPAKLVNGFYQGQRVAVRFTYLPGYDGDPVWMRIASRTVRQIAADSGIYEIALDLRGEEPPDIPSATVACPSPTASASFYPLGGSGSHGQSNPSDGHVYYWVPGHVRPLTVAEATGLNGVFHFADWDGSGPAASTPGGAGTTDYAGDCAQNRVRLLVDGDGTWTVHTSVYTQARTLRATLYHHEYGSDPGDPTSGTDVVDAVYTGLPVGTDFEVPVSTHGGTHCTHFIDITDEGPPASSCGDKWGFDGADWVLAS